MILAIDQGTSATKACIFEPPAVLRGSATVPVRRQFGHDGTVSQDPQELVESCRQSCHLALVQAAISAKDLTGVALANQGESFLLFDANGVPLSPVISWQDTRCGDVLLRLAGAPGAEAITALTGLPLHPEFVAPKLSYRLGHLHSTAGVRMGTLDTWLMHELDPRHPFVTDRATASRTMLMGLVDADWSEDLLRWFHVPREILPSVVGCDQPGSVFDIEDTEVPVLSSGYDMGLALLGHGCTRLGDVKATFGTSLGVMACTGARPQVVDGLLGTVAYQWHGKSTFALDGEIAAAGSLLEWGTQIGIAHSVAELVALAESAADTGGVVVVPAINGLGAPYWRSDVEGVILGCTAATGRAELARAIVDAIAWSLRDVVVLLRESGFACDTLRVDGGASRSSLLLQRCATIAGLEVLVSTVREATAYGGAALAMLSHGLANEGDVLTAARDSMRSFTPGLAPTEDEVQRWGSAIRVALTRSVSRQQLFPL
jgi:glycerol kinase